MDILTDIDVPRMVMTSALSVAAGSYLNAKLAISTNLAAVSKDKAFVRRIGQRIARLGSSTTIYKMLERVVEVEGQGAADALWFEQQMWSYNQLKDLIDRMAALLKSRDIMPGDTNGVITSNSPEIAGAAGITLESLTNETKVTSILYNELKRKAVPSYAPPRRVCLMEKVVTGVTFKQAKGDLVK